MAVLPTLLGLLALLATVPPLSDAQRAQLEDTTDRTRTVDAGGLYALLPNVLEWREDDEMVARLGVDYDALLNESDAAAAHRGEVVLIEGRFYGKSHRFELSRAGPWGEAVTMWVLALDDELERLAVVFLVDPQGRWHERAPRRGQAVRVPARFYKIWQQADNQGQMTDYLVFVGRFPTLADTGGAIGTGQTGIGQKLVLVVLLAGALLVILRRSWRLSLRPRSLPRQQERRERSADAHDAPKAESESVFPDDTGTPLPEDPAAALDELSRRQHGR